MLEELKRLFFELGEKKYNLSKEQVSKAKLEWKNSTIEEIVELAARNDFLPVLEHFAKNEGDLHFIIDECREKVNLLNIAAGEGSLSIVNYLLDNNIFTVDQQASVSTKTPLQSAIEGSSIEAAKLLLKRGADANIAIKPSPSNIFTISYDADNKEINNIEIFKFLIKYGMQIPDDLKQIYPDHLTQEYSSKAAIKDFLLSIKKLDNLYDNALTTQNKDFIDTYKTSDSEIQEIWNVRVSRNHLSKIAEFIEKKFSKESVIEYKEYFVLREYNSLSTSKKELLEIFLAQKNFSSYTFIIIKVDNYIKDHFFEIAGIAKNLDGSTFKTLDLIPMITQYLQFENSSIKIAGAITDNDINSELG